MDAVLLSGHYDSHARQSSGLQALLAAKAGPLPLLPEDAAALLHSLATGSRLHSPAHLHTTVDSAVLGAACASAAKCGAGSPQQMETDLMAVQVLRVDSHGAAERQGRQPPVPAR